MNKLVINHLGRMFVTSDASTLLRELEVEHPAAKMLVMAAEMQHQEVGDMANFVVTFAGELLSHAESLLRLVRGAGARDTMWASSCCQPGFPFP
jgi:T-complex protein 1 subunit theta